METPLFDVKGSVATVIGAFGEADEVLVGIQPTLNGIMNNVDETSKLTPLNTITRFIVKRNDPRSLRAMKAFIKANFATLTWEPAEGTSKGKWKVMKDKELIFSPVTTSWLKFAKVAKAKPSGEPELKTLDEAVARVKRSVTELAKDAVIAGFREEGADFLIEAQAHMQKWLNAKRELAS